MFRPVSHNWRRPVIESPCNRVCTLDPATDQCLGCGRSLAEIMAWTRMTDAERARVVSDCERRLAHVPAKWHMLRRDGG